MQQKKTLIIATLIIVAMATIAACVSYTLVNQPVKNLNGQTGQSITYGEPTPGTMPGLETRPDNQTDGSDGPQL